MVALITKSFTVTGNYFHIGQYWLVAVDEDRNDRKWVTITNKGYHFKTQLPRDCVVVVNEKDLKVLAEAGFVQQRLIDCKEKSLSGGKLDQENA